MGYGKGGYGKSSYGGSVEVPEKADEEDLRELIEQANSRIKTLHEDVIDAREDARKWRDKAERHHRRVYIISTLTFFGGILASIGIQILLS